MWKFFESLIKILGLIFDWILYIAFALAVLYLLKGFKVIAKESEAGEMVLLQQVALAEAGNQGIGGMAFVMQVIYNRVEDERFPDNITDVIMDEGQFASVVDESYLKYEPTDNSRKAVELLDILQNQGALYFENPENSSWCERTKTKVFEYEDHTFYK